MLFSMDSLPAELKQRIASLVPSVVGLVGLWQASTLWRDVVASCFACWARTLPDGIHREVLKAQHVDFLSGFTDGKCLSTTCFPQT